MNNTTTRYGADPYIGSFDYSHFDVKMFQDYQEGDIIPTRPAVGKIRLATVTEIRVFNDKGFYAPIPM